MDSRDLYDRSRLLSLAIAAVEGFRCRHHLCRLGRSHGCRYLTGGPPLERGMAGEEPFWRRHGPLFRRIRRDYPEFWEELREVAERHRERTYTSHGARVRDWPETREMGCRLAPPELADGMRPSRRTDQRRRSRPRGRRCKCRRACGATGNRRLQNTTRWRGSRGSGTTLRVWPRGLIRGGEARTTRTTRRISLRREGVARGAGTVVSGPTVTRLAHVLGGLFVMAAAGRG